MSKFDLDIAVGMRAAQQDVAGFALVVRSAKVEYFSSSTSPSMQHALAAAALAFLAAMRQGDALAERGVEHRFALLDFQFDADGLEADRVDLRVRHHRGLAVVSLKCRAYSPGEGAGRSGPLRLSCSVAGIDREALAVFGQVLPRALRRQRAERVQRAAKRVAAHIVERPHLLVVEAQMRLRDQGLAVGADEAEVLDRVGQIPAVIELSHSRWPLKRPIAGVGRPWYSAANASTLCVQRSSSWAKV